MSFRYLLAVGLLCAACGGSGGADAAGAGGAAGAAGSGGAGAGGSGGGAGAAGGGGMPGATLNVVLGASTAAYAHQDQLASQTAKQVQAGVRSLELLDENGQSWTLFSSATGASVVSYDDGATASLATLSGAAIRAGHYVQGRLVQDWSRLEVGATLHGGVAPVAGTLTVLQITSEGVSVGGKSYAAGDYEHTFTGAGASKSFSGTLPIPEKSNTAEAEAVVENGDWVVYFPLDLTVDATTAGTLTITANMDRAFRWTDTPALGYQANVYDIAPPLYEIVEQFGANRFDVTLSK